MSEETSLTEQQQDEQDKGFWRLFWATIRAHLLTTILITIIAVQWVLMMAIERNAMKRAQDVVRAIIEMQQTTTVGTHDERASSTARVP